jgi:hypothetical protein
VCHVFGGQKGLACMQSMTRKSVFISVAQSHLPNSSSNLYISTQDWAFFPSQALNACGNCARRNNYNFFTFQSRRGNLCR